MSMESKARFALDEDKCIGCGKCVNVCSGMVHRSETGILRFNEIRRLMTDCSQKMLSQTLKNLEQSHLVHREVYPEVPPRVEYSLTDTGKSLMPAIMALIEWGQEHFKEVVTD